MRGNQRRGSPGARGGDLRLREDSFQSRAEAETGLHGADGDTVTSAVAWGGRERERERERECGRVVDTSFRVSIGGHQ